MFFLISENCSDVSCYFASGQNRELSKSNVNNGSGPSSGMHLSAVTQNDMVCIPPTDPINR